MVGGVVKFSGRKEKTMYHIAGKFENREEARRVYTLLDDALNAQGFEAHLSSLELSNDYYVNFLSDGDESSIPALVKETVLRILGEGQISQLPEETIAVIQQRRAERRARGTGPFESHDPAQISYRTPVLRDAQTHEEVAHLSPEITSESPYKGPAPGSPVYPVQLKDLPQPLRAQAARAQSEVIRKAKEKARPFIVRYRSKVDEIAATADEFDFQLALYQETLKTAVAYLFTESAMRLHRAVWDQGRHDLPIPDTALCIELVTPIEMPYGVVKALGIYNLRGDEAIERLRRKYPKMGLEHLPERPGSWYRIELIGSDLWMLDSETYDAEGREWIYLSDHQCDACQRDQNKEIVQACSACKDRTGYWASWLRTALLMINREYAVSPEPAPFPVQVVTYEEEGIKKVGHGKNMREIKTTFKREVEYRIISFDVSTPAPRRERPLQEERAEEEKRANWLTMYGKEALIYRRIHFEDIHRDYSGPHYKHIIERCSALGGTFTEEGREYKLSYLPDGTAVVTSTILGFDKYVPMLREKKAIRKVIASAYEQPES
jgi:hypothetical protein